MVAVAAGFAYLRPGVEHFFFSLSVKFTTQPIESEEKKTLGILFTPFFVLSF